MVRREDFITALSSSFVVIVFFIIAIMVFNELPDEMGLFKIINLIFFVTVIIIIIELITKIRKIL